MEDVGPWDGERAVHTPVETPAPALVGEGHALSTWKLLVDNGSMQDGDKAYRATGRAPVARVSRATYAVVGPMVTLTGDRGSVTLPAVPADLDDGVVWVPANSFGNGVLADLASPGSRVTVKGAVQ
jgi:NADH-quinone oxidoreductase subunit G